MGFSTSGAVAIMLIGFLLAAGVLFPTVFTAGSDTGSAFSAQADHNRDQMNTAIAIDRVDAATNDELEAITVTVDNDGTTALDVVKTDVLLDGDYLDMDDYNTSVIDVDDGEDVTDDDRVDSDVWYPGSRLEIRVDDGTLSEDTDDVSDLVDGDELDRVKVTTQHGIEAASEAIE